MCFQGFVHCSCQHINLLEASCSLAEGIPFYIKVACPEYKYQSISVRRLCGRGRFYCAQTTDGECLEQIQNILEQANAQLELVNTRTERANARASDFHRTANNVGASQTARQRHLAYSTLSATLQHLEELRAAATALRMQILTIFSECHNYYLQRAQAARAGHDGRLPPFRLSVNLKNQLSPELLGHVVAFEAACGGTNGIPDTVGTIDASRGGLRPPEHSNIRAQTGPSMNAPRLQQTQAPIPDTASARTLVEARSGVTLPPRPVNATHFTRLIEQHDDDPSLAYPIRKKKKTSVLSDDSYVRRSARSRDKRVNYLESDDASWTSREPSPEKSGRDSFSPSRSEATASPEKRKRPRGRKRRINRNSTSEVEHIAPTKSRSNTGARMRSEHQDPFSTPTNPPEQAGQIIDRAGLSISGNDQKKSRRHGNAQVPNRPYFEPLISTNSMSRPGSISYPATSHNVNVPGDAAYKGYANAAAANMAAARRSVPGISSSMNNSHINRPMGWTAPNVTHQNPYGQYSLPMWQSQAPPMGYAPSSLYAWQHQVQPNAYTQDNQSYGQPNAYVSNNLPLMQAQLHPNAYGVMNLPMEQPQTQPNWLINTPVFNTTAVAATLPAAATNSTNPTLLNSPRDSYQQDIANSIGAADAFSANETYQRMRRSFRAPADLTPQTASTTSVSTTDPQKRALPTSSPLPPTKRSRLSLPGGEEKNVGGDLVSDASGETGSSPSRMQPRNAPTAAPNLGATLAPTARMYFPAKQVGDSGKMEGLTQQNIAKAQRIVSEAVQFVLQQSVARQGIAQQRSAQQDIGQQGIALRDLLIEPPVDQTVAEEFDNEMSDVDWGFNDESFVDD